MAGLDSLPPDQRAVLQLVLRQGRSYDDLAGLLRIEPEAVRDRAIAGVSALAGGGGADAGTRGRVVDYLLAQQGVNERAATRADLAHAGPARDYAAGARAALAPFSADGLPELPEASEASGASAAPARRDGEPAPSRLGGIALLAGLGILLVAVVLALALSGDDDPAPADRAQNGTTQGTGASGNANRAGGQPRTLAQVNLTPTQAGDDALATARLVTQGDSAGFLVSAQGIEPPGRDRFLGLWLTGPRARPVLLAAVVGAQIRNEEFSGVTPVPRSLRDYDRLVLAAQEGSNRRQVPRAPGPIVLAGALDVPDSFRPSTGGGAGGTPTTPGGGAAGGDGGG